MSYDADKCEAILEVRTDKCFFDTNTKGYEYLFNIDPNDCCVCSPTLSDMAMTRRYEVRGVSKCTEKALLTFDICYNPPLVPLNCPNSNYMNYMINAIGVDDWAYELFYGYI